MLRTEPVSDVTRLRFFSWRSRSFGYDASAYLFDGVLVDCGFPRAHRDLRTVLASHRPVGVILTHFHEDHAGNADIVAQLGVPIAAAAATLELLRDPPPVQLYQRYVWGVPRPLTVEPVPFAPSGFELIATPGHSGDHHVVWHPEREILFAGDLFLGVKVRVVRRGEDPRLLVDSLRRAIALRPRVMLDTHRGPVENPVGALTAKANWLEETIGLVDQLADRGWSERAIAREVLGSEPVIRVVTFGDLSRRNFVRAAAQSRRR